MKLLFFIWVAILLPNCLWAHPGIGIVADSKGIIYFSDLFNIYKIISDKKSIVIPNVHAHELYIDSADALVGEDVQYDAVLNKFYYQLWKLTAAGDFSWTTSKKEAYLLDDYSLARDRDGNAYYIKRFGKYSNTGKMYIRYNGGGEAVFATGNFDNISWLHPQNDGSILYTKNNNVYRVTPGGQVVVLAKDVGKVGNHFFFPADAPIVYGLWQDKVKNVYVAVFSEQMVKRIDNDGRISDFYSCQGKFAPVQGVFDIYGNLWLMESSDKNETRVTKVLSNTASRKVATAEVYRTFAYAFTAAVFIILLLLLFINYSQIKFLG